MTIKAEKLTEIAELEDMTELLSNAIQNEAQTRYTLTGSRIKFNAFINDTDSIKKSTFEKEYRAINSTVTEAERMVNSTTSDREFLMRKIVTILNRI